MEMREREKADKSELFNCAPLSICKFFTLHVDSSWLAS